ncbi:MAG: 4a-hydroxytetrahydrobiopterin dehydratase [Myxococcota bacterium]
MPSKLDQPALDAFLADHPDWSVEGDFLRREFTAKSARDALRLIQRIGDLAEGAFHHPNLEWVYNRLVIRLQTHDAGGITRRDTHLAGCVEDVLGE